MPNGTEIVLTSRHTRLLASLVLGFACCATASGATSPTTACEQTTDLQSLEVPVTDLSAITVGHMTDDADGDELLNSSPDPAQSSAPALFLAPRIESILQAIFSAVAIETPDSEFTDQDLPFLIEYSSQAERPLSSVAGDAHQPDALGLNDAAAEQEDDESVQNLQRQMYRTDI